MNRSVIDFANQFTRNWMYLVHHKNPSVYTPFQLTISDLNNYRLPDITHHIFNDKNRYNLGKAYLKNRNLIIEIHNIYEDQSIGFMSVCVILDLLNQNQLNDEMIAENINNWLVYILRGYYQKPPRPLIEI